MTTVKSAKVKRLTRSVGRKFLGVCGGIAEYVGIDPVIVRILWVLVTAFTGFVPGIIVYFLAAWVIPEKQA